MSHYHAECGACFVLLFRPFSLHSFHQFMVVVSNSTYTVFIHCFLFIAIFILPRGCCFHMCGDNFSLMWILVCGTSALEYLSAQFFAASHKRPRHLKVCVYSSVFAIRFELTGKHCCTHLYCWSYCRQNPSRLQGILARLLALEKCLLCSVWYWIMMHLITQTHAQCLSYCRVFVRLQKWKCSIVISKEVFFTNQSHEAEQSRFSVTIFLLSWNSELQVVVFSLSSSCIFYQAGEIETPVVVLSSVLTCQIASTSWPCHDECASKRSVVKYDSSCVYFCSSRTYTIHS